MVKVLKPHFLSRLERERKSQYRSKLEEPPHSARPGPQWAFAGSEEGSGTSGPQARGKAQKGWHCSCSARPTGSFLPVPHQRGAGRGRCCHLHPGQESREREGCNAGASPLFPWPLRLWPVCAGQALEAAGWTRTAASGSTCGVGLAPGAPSALGPQPLSTHPREQVQL